MKPHLVLLLLLQTGKIPAVLQFNIDTIVTAIVEVVQLILVPAEKMIAEGIVKRLGMSPKWLLARLRNPNTITTIIGISIDQGKTLHQNLAIKFFFSQFCVLELIIVANNHV